MTSTESVIMRKCPKCGITSDRFWKDKTRPKGIFRLCIDCANKWFREKRKRNPKSYHARDRRYYQKHKEELNKKQKERYKTQKNKNMSRLQTRKAIKNGLIKKENCMVCGDKKSMAHHDDYAKPLEIRWLCGSCHKIWHRDNGEGLNG